MRTTFGPPLAAIDLTDNPDENADKVLKAERKTLAENTIGGFQEYACGCTLFSNYDMAPFAIGPAQLEPRLEWLERKAREGAVTHVMARHVQKQCRGEKVRKRKNVIDKMHEADILDAVGNSRYVCSVATNGLASDAGKLQAQTAARLALRCIALWWEMPASALGGFNLP